MAGLFSAVGRGLAKRVAKEAAKDITKQTPEAVELGSLKAAPRQIEMPLNATEEVPVGLDQRSLKDQLQESLDKLGNATSIAPTPPRMFGDPKYSFLNPIIEQTGRKTEDIIAEGVGEYSDVAGKRFITNKRVSNSQINPYNGPGPKFKGTLSEDDITEEQVKNLAKELRSEDVGLLKTNLLKKDKFTVVEDKTGGQLESIGKQGDSYGIVTVAVSGVKNAPQYKKNRGMESDHIYGLHLNIQGDAALLTHKVKDVRASAKKGQTVYQQPSLKPTMVGNMKGRNIIGTIKVAGRKEHPLYDVIDIDAATFSDYGFNAGGFLNNNLVEFDASIFEEDTINMNEGGAVMPMEKQMELFEDGGSIDPVSGNGIPLGSTAKEVRDDQPAMLSEGEMVVPADVVRYFGVEYFMNLRDQAKMGYKKMEAMGQFGTDKGQTLPDDTIFNAGGPPFTIEDIEVIEDYEENEVEKKEPVKAADGALISSGISSAATLLPALVSSFGTYNTIFGGSRSSSGSFGSSTTSAEQDLENLGSQVAFSPSNTQNLMGVETFNYLNSFMPSGLVNRSNTTERSAVGNYIANLFSNIPATAQTAQGDGATGGAVSTGGTADTGGEGPVGTAGPSGGGSSNVSVNAPGTGDIFTMMNNPTAANIQGLKDFGELKDSEFGKAFLSGMGMLVSAAMNPGQYAPVVGTVQGLAGMAEQALAGTNNISKGFQDLKDIPIIQANMATRAARSFEYDLAQLTPEEKANFNVVMEALEIGDINDIDVTAPGVTVGVTDRGETVVKGPGRFAAAYNRNGEIIGDKITKVVDPKTVEEEKERGKTSINNATTAADPKGGGTYDAAISRGMGGGPQNPAEAMGLAPAVSAITGAMSPSFGTDDTPDDVSVPAPTQEIAAAMSPSFGTDDTPDDVNVPDYSREAFDYSTEGDTSSVSSIGTSGMDTGFDVADAMGDDSVGDDGTGSTGGSTGGGMGSVAESAAEAAASGLSGIDSFDTGDDGGGDGGGGDSGGGDGKIVCTMMNHLYGFNLKQNALWLRYAKTKQLDPAYQLGYHKIFTPLVRKMPTNKSIAFALSWLATQRTNSIKKELKGSKVTLYKSIVRPTLGSVCFITGKLIQKGILKPAKLETLQFNEKP